MPTNHRLFFGTIGSTSASVLMHAQDDIIQLVLVTTDDRKQQVWAAAASSARALGLVLVEVPEGWSASLLDVELTSQECEELKLQTGEVRKLR
jgi:hypothetical protein